jgi:hypothetical protein
MLVGEKDIQFAECLLSQSDIACHRISTMTIFIAVIPQEQPMGEYMTQNMARPRLTIATFDRGKT